MNNSRLKTHCMLIGTKPKTSKCRKLYIKVDDVVLNSVEKAKLLEVTIDKSLTCLEPVEFFRQKSCYKLRKFLNYRKGQLELY